MLQHKQEERELKRYEGDIIKKQHQLRRTMDGLQNSKFWNLDSYTSLQFLNSKARSSMLCLTWLDCYFWSCTLLNSWFLASFWYNPLLLVFLLLNIAPAHYA